LVQRIVMMQYERNKPLTVKRLQYVGAHVLEPIRGKTDQKLGGNVAAVYC